MASFLNNSIRLSVKNQEKLKKGEEETFKLVNKTEKKNLKKA